MDKWIVLQFNERVVYVNPVYVRALEYAKVRGEYRIEYNDGDYDYFNTFYVTSFDRMMEYLEHAKIR